MARQQADRENLLREATALLTRIELAIPGFNESITCGFRSDGSASFYFGADPVYQFNAAGQLRRAFVGGTILKAERGRLVALSRARSASEVALIRHELTDSEMRVLISDLCGDLQRLKTALEARAFLVAGQVPADADVAGRVLTWLENSPPAVQIAPAPNAG
jgi:hypothetical protein